MTDETMNNSFDFENIGKRMPYSTPDSFFEELEKNILASTESGNSMTKSSRSTIKRRLVTVFTTVAAAAVFLVFFNHVTKSEETKETSFNDVEQAFAKLNSADQDYLIQVYQDDIFLNEQ